MKSLFAGSILPYATHVFTVELLLLLLFAPIEALRFAWGTSLICLLLFNTFLSSGTRGNLTETSAFVTFFVLLSVANIALCVYLGVFQSYVLLIEEVRYPPQNVINQSLPDPHLYWIRPSRVGITNWSDTNCLFIQVERSKINWQLWIKIFSDLDNSLHLIFKQCYFCTR